VTKLETLSLGGTKVTDAGLEHLQGLANLATLNLENNRGVSDSGLVHLKGLTKLRTLNLGGTKVTDAGVGDLQKALPKVKIIHRPSSLAFPAPRHTIKLVGGAVLDFKWAPIVFEWKSSDD
jgi:hypothetical protein